MLISAIAQCRSGGFVVGGEDGVYRWNPQTNLTTPFCKPENLPGNRLNDGAVDPQGRLWIGSMMQNIGAHGEDLGISADTGMLHCVNPDGTSRICETGIGVSNGPCWSPDGGTFYFSDTNKQTIYAYDFDGATGAIANRRIFNDTKDHGFPDGATVDAEGFLWSARWDGGCVLRIDPKGRIDRIFEVPATRVTCPVFGGDDMETLYLTTSRAHSSADVLSRFPEQGSLFAVRPGVKGAAKNMFAG